MIPVEAAAVAGSEASDQAGQVISDSHVVQRETEQAVPSEGFPVPLR